MNKTDVSNWTLSPPPQPPLWLTSLLLLVTLAGSIWFVNFVSRYGEALERERVQMLAITAAASMSPDAVAALQGAPADADSAAFATVRAQLQRVHAVNPDFRFVYLMRADASGRMVFLADAEASDSPDYSAPGDVYDGPAQNLLQVFSSGRAMVEAPSRDRWGYWVTGLAPVRSDDNGRVLAVLGTDMNAEAWLTGKARYRNFALTISALAMALVVIFLIGTRLQQRSRLHIEAINARLAYELAELARAQGELRLADVVVRNTEEGVMVLDAEQRIESVNPAFERITGFSQEEVLGAPPRMLGNAQPDSPGFIADIDAGLQADGKWEGIVPAQRRDGTAYPQETVVNMVRGEHEEIQHYAVVFRDATQQQQLEDSLRTLSATDGLTQIGNRRLFDETLDREWQRALRDRAPLSLVLADIDYFKRFNDHYGHVAGDECLKQVAAAMHASLHRGGDFVARYGGEEFAVLLPATAAAQARTIAEKIRQSVTALAIAHANNPQWPLVTISLGVASMVPDASGESVRLIECADRALYAAKQGGRNRVESA